MKKRPSLLIIGVLLLLAVVAILVYKNKGKSSTLDQDAREFKYKDTAAVTKIFIADKEGDQSTIERTKTGWVVNNKYPCRSDAILNLLEAVRNVEVKMPVNKNARENVLKIMATAGIKAEIYAGDDLVKQYYIGHEAPDSEGSYMLLTDVSSGENYKEPFICFIPGFQGYLIPRYIAKENEWRDRTVMNYTPPQIKQIKVVHFENDSSFTIELVNTKTFVLRDKAGKELPFDEFKMKQYIAYYQNLSYESLFNSKSKRLQDSLQKTKPFDVITVSGKDFKAEKYEFFHKHTNPDIPEHGVAFKYDPDRMFMRFGNNEWATIQSFVFGKLLVSPAYFSPAGVKK